MPNGTGPRNPPRDNFRYYRKKPNGGIKGFIIIVIIVILLFFIILFFSGIFGSPAQPFPPTSLHSFENVTNLTNIGLMLND